jgi:hypothetical protein
MSGTEDPAGEMKEEAPMTDGPVLTRYPHDRLSRLADAMTEALDRVPGTGDVRAVVLLDDGEDGCIHPHHYPDPEGAANALLFINVVTHLAAMGEAIGVRVEVLINGKKVGAAPRRKGGAS